MSYLQPRIPGPAALVRGAFRIVEWEIAVARGVLMLPARALALVDDAEELVSRVGTLLTEGGRTVAAIDGIVMAAAETVEGVRETVVRADRVVGEVERTVVGADAIVARVGTTVTSADSLVVGAEGLLGRATPMVDLAESTLVHVRPVLEAMLSEADLDAEMARLVASRIADVLAYLDRTAATLQPIVDEVVASIDPDEVKAVVALIDHLPALTASVERDILPIIRNLDTVAPEVHEILEVAQRCLEALAGIPGFQFLRRRGETSRVEIPGKDEPGSGA